jgi:hypothetical protein
MIHLGGGDHSSLLPFAFSDCDKLIQGELRRGEIPSGSAVKVAFAVAIKKGGLWATRVCTAKESAGVAPKRRGKPSKSGKKKSAKR